MLTNKQILERLKELYNQGLVSALVGAGFTKNMYKDAVNWWQLLKGIVLAAYNLEINQMYDQYKHRLKFYQCAQPLKDMEDDFVDIIIKRDGYLKIVSNYIKSKGCREAIDVYIEEHNPFFIATPNGIMVSGDSSTILTDKDLSTHRAFLECKWQQIFTTNYDNALEFTSEHYHLSHEVITKDYEMSRTRLNNSIVKIHGNLVNQDKSLEDSFEFDNDKSRRYIISEEDYNTYLSRHQAFSYLLRIAMLSGAYCLIGFSGDDPNFLAWLEWVKDILDKDFTTSSREEDKIKVFLISVDKNSISKEKQLFYKNHHIAVINLNDADIQNELGVSSPTPSYPDLFKALFAYLSKESVNVEYTSPTVDYSSLWSSIYSKEYHKKNKESYADELEQIRTYRSLSHFEKSYYYEELVLEHILGQAEPLTEEQKQAVVFALSDLCWPKVQLPENVISQLKDEPDWTTYATFQDTLSANESTLPRTTDSECFQNILRAFYRFDFRKAESLLKDWNPSEMWLCRKASLNYYYDKDSTLRDLKTLSTTSKDLFVRYNAVVIHDYIEFTIGGRKDRQQFKGINGIPEMIFHHVNQLRMPKIKIERYGQQNNTVSYKDAVTDPFEKSLRFFRFITENGLNPTYSILNVISAEDWYLAFCNLMRHYPWACLYYSAQYNNKRVLTRIGQDYAYSANLKDVLPCMLNCILEALVEGSIPLFMRFGILQICSRFFIAIPEDQYYEQLKKYLQQVYFIEKGDMVFSQDAHTFVALALNSLSANAHITDMLSTLLDYYDINPRDASELITSHLRWNTIPSLDSSIMSKIGKVLSGSDRVDSIYIALRLQEHNLVPASKLATLLDSIITDSTVLSTIGMHPLACLCRLAKDSIKHLVILKEEILRRNYWGSANQNTFGGEEQFFRFSLLPKEMVFGVEESVTIALKLQEVFNALSPHIVRNDQLFQMFYDDVLEEMENYVETNSLSFSKDFTDKFNSVMSTYRGFASIEQSFYGETSDYIGRGIDRVHKMMRNSKPDDIKPYVNMALDRLLFKNNVANTRLLDLVAVFVWKNTKEVCSDSSLVNKLFWLLQIYSHDDLRVYDFEVVDATYSFLLIAKALKSQGVNNENIDWWIENENNNRFNYIEIE